MSYWIEVRCCKMSSGQCFSARQVDTPMMLTRNATMAAVTNTLLRLTREATALKWHYTNNGWVCPRCQE